MSLFFSGMNLETAAVISELIVDRTLDELEGCTGRLVCSHGCTVSLTCDP